MKPTDEHFSRRLLVPTTSSLLLAHALLTASTLLADTVVHRATKGFSILYDVEYPATEGSFSETLSLSKFDPQLGSLSKVTVAWSLEGEVAVGVSPRGPLFPGGGGTVSGTSTLSFILDLPTSHTITGSDTISGTHTGSIPGPPGVGSSDTLDLPFSATGTDVLTDSADLLLFVSNDTIDFDVLLTMYDVDAMITNPGPRFGMSVNIPPPRLNTTLTYEYSRIPEPSSALLARFALLTALYRRPRRRRRTV